MQFD
jgi:hypothetical protein